MTLWIPLAVAVIIIIVLAAVVFGKLSAGQAPKYKAKTLLTENEKEFFLRLKRALPVHHIFPQVAMGTILDPNVDRHDRRYLQIRGTFSQKIIDFLICDGETFKIIAVVELDDRTHNAERDEKRDSMLKAAGYRVIRWHSRKKPTEEQIRAQVEGLNQNAAPAAKPSPPRLQVVSGENRC